MIYTALDTFYLKDEQISNSPSRKDKVDEETETNLRHYGCELIQDAGILLKLPQAVMATGQVLFHRFYCKKSFARFNVERVAASCVWLAAKLEESPRKIPAVLNVFHRLDRRRDAAPIDSLDPFSKKYKEMKTELITTERHLLKEMGFICHVEHPHKFVIHYIVQLDAGPLMQDAWSMANDSLRTTLCVRYRSEVVACGVVYAAARRHRVALPEDPPWWEAFDARKRDIDEVCRVLGNLYQQPKARYIEVGRDRKPFVLTSRAWDLPPGVQDSLLRRVVNGVGPTSNPPTSSNVDRGLSGDVAATAAKTVPDRSSDTKEGSKTLDEAQVLSTNGHARDHASVGKLKPSNEREVTIEEKSRDKVRYRAVDRELESAQDKDHEREDRDRERTQERDRKRERDKGRERIMERDYRSKERSRESGHSDKSRLLLSSRDRDFQNSGDKDWHRHRHHPYA